MIQNEGQKTKRHTIQQTEKMKTTDKNKTSVHRGYTVSYKSSVVLLIVKSSSCIVGDGRENTIYIKGKISVHEKLCIYDFILSE